MQRLNIPLSRHQKTTRRPRWVVWITVGFLACALFLVYYLCLFFLTRPKLIASAPSGTEFAVRFLYKDSTSDNISQLLNNISLISNRSFTINDLKPVLSGEFVVFVGSDYSRSVAFRTKDPEQLKNTLNSQKINLTKIDKQTVLLSEKLVAIEGFDTPNFFSRNTLKPHKQWIGDIFFNEGKIHSPIYSSKTKYEVVFPFHNKNNLKERMVPTNTVSFLSLPVPLGFETKTISSLFSPISSFLNDSFNLFLENLSNNKGFVLISEDDEGVGFIISSEKKLFNTTNFDLNNLLKTISALNSPRVVQKILKDGSFAQELISDPDLVSVEQFSLFGDKTLRTQNSGSGEFLGTENDKEFLITNREGLLGAFSHPNTDNDFTSLCGSTSLGIDLEKLSAITEQKATFASAALLFPLSDSISKIGLANKKYSTRLFLCK